MTKVTRLSVGEGGESRSRQAHLREIARDPDSPLGTIGQELRGARMSRGEDLASVSRVLKIRKDHLEALENDHMGALPGRTYAVGFVRAYAEHLGLNPEQVVERFRTEIAGRDDTSKNAGFPVDEESSGLSWSWILFALFLLGLIAYGAYYLLQSRGADPVQPSAAPVPTEIAPALTKPAHRSPANRATAVSPGASHAGNAAPPAIPAGGGTVYGKMNTNAHVVLHVMQSTHVLVQTEDGRAFINKELQPGDSYQVPNMGGLALTAEHGNAVQVVLDGKVMGNAGAGGEPVEALSLDRDALANRSHASSGQ
ncbi:MAG: helix-turn-helix domain-containing protein [Rhizomicrobium sp.]|jgi:cytoskeleton protein RodZ